MPNLSRRYGDRPTSALCVLLDGPLDAVHGLLHATVDVVALGTLGVQPDGQRRGPVGRAGVDVELTVVVVRARRAPLQRAPLVLDLDPRLALDVLLGAARGSMCAVTSTFPSACGRADVSRGMYAGRLRTSER